MLENQIKCSAVVLDTTKQIESFISRQKNRTFSYNCQKFYYFIVSVSHMEMENAQNGDNKKKREKNCW